MKAMCRHMYNKVSKATEQLDGLEMTVCRVFNNAVFGEVHASVTCNDLKPTKPAECAKAVCICRAGDKHPACTHGQTWKRIT